MSIEGSPIKLPKADRDRFEFTGPPAWPKKSEGRRPGAGLADGRRPDARRDVHRPAGHVKQVAEYIRRTTRVKYREEDLARAAYFPPCPLAKTHSSRRW